MIRLLIIIPVAILEAVRTAAQGVFGDVALTEFVPAGSPTGEAPATHYWLAGPFNAGDAAKVTALQTSFPTAHVESYDFATAPGRPFALLAEMGLKTMKPKESP